MKYSMLVLFTCCWGCDTKTFVTNYFPFYSSVTGSLLLTAGTISELWINLRRSSWLPSISLNGKQRWRYYWEKKASIGWLWQQKQRETESKSIISSPLCPQPQRRIRNIPNGVTNSVIERNSYGFGYHNRQLDSRNQSFPICNRSKNI